jgi:CheY-like chemotaxis protein
MLTPPCPSARVLFAEDDDLVRDIAAETLRYAGYEVIAVADGDEALALLPHFRPDLILSDVRMPRLDGLQLLQAIRRDPELGTIPFILISAKAEVADQRLGMSLGADDYVTKPYDPRDLLQAIEARLRRRREFVACMRAREQPAPLAGIAADAATAAATDCASPGS